MDAKHPRLGRMHHGAGYKLHDEVEAPTPALLRASQIGVLVHDEPMMATAPNRDAFLVASYGAARQAARKNTVELLLDEIAEQNPEADLYEAYSSKAMRERVQQDGGIEIPSVEEALEMLLKSGYTRVAIASLHLFPGAEYACMVETFNSYKERFKRLVLGTPLLFWMGQEEQRDDLADFVTALRLELPPQAPEEATLLMAHGTKHPSNAYYPLLQTRLEMAEWDRAFVYTLAGWPRLEDVTPKLKELGVKRVRLVPLMLAIGAHASRDMAGDAQNSHRSRLEAEGFEVDVFPKALGEMPSLRAMYVERANEAWDALQNE